MTRVLLTGASGFLGAHVLKHYLAETDWSFVVPVSFAHKGVPERLTWAVPDEEWSRVDVIRHDLATPVNATTSALFGDVDMILNFASDTHPPRSVHQPVEFVHNNVDIALYLLEYARTLPGLRAFVQISTDSVYGPALVGTHREWDPIVPNNPYSASKAAQEALTVAYWRSFKVPAMIVATMNPTGETQDCEKFIPMAIGKILRGETLTIHADAAGAVGARTYIYAQQMASALLHLLRNHPPVMHGGEVQRPDRWNVVGPKELDNLIVAKLIASALDIDLRYELATVDRPEHGHRYSMTGDKLAKAGWTSDPGVEQAIERMARWTRDNPLWLNT